MPVIINSLNPENFDKKNFTIINHRILKFGIWDFEKLNESFFYDFRILKIGIFFFIEEIEIWNLKFKIIRKFLGF